MLSNRCRGGLFAFERNFREVFCVGSAGEGEETDWRPPNRSRLARVAMVLFHSSDLGHGGVGVDVDQGGNEGRGGFRPALDVRMIQIDHT